MTGQHLLNEPTRTQSIQAAAATLLLLNVTEPGLEEDQYYDKTALIFDQFIPCDSDDPEEEDLCDEMFEAAMELAAKLTEFAKNFTN